MIQLQEHDHLKMVMKYYRDLRLAQDTQNNAIRVATAKREKKGRSWYASATYATNNSGNAGAN